MSDIFKLIRANIERNRDNERQDEQKLALPNTQKRIDIEDFIIGEEERKPQTSLPPNKKKKSVEIDEVDLIEKEIGNDFDTKNYLSDIEQVDYIKLDKMPKDKQLRLLKKEYLVLLDKIKEVSSEFTKVDKAYKEQSVDFHTTKKHYAKLKEFVRNISTLIPDGTDLKTKLEAPNWRLDDIEDEMISRLNFAFNRAKNADTYLEQETAELTTQIQGLKNKITKVENSNLELEQLVGDLNNQISDLNYQLENAVFPSEEDDLDDYNDEYNDNYNSNDNYEENYGDDNEDEDTYYPQGEEDEEDYQKPHKEDIDEEFDKRYKDEYGFDDEEEEELPPPAPKKQPVQKPERKPQQREQRNQEAPVRKESSERNNNRHENTKPQRNREEERQQNRPKQNDRNERPNNERPKREERPNNERPKREERPNNERPKREERPNNERPKREERPNNERPKREERPQQKPSNDSRENRNNNQKPNPPERTRENPKNTHPNERPKKEDASRRNRDNEQRPKSDDRPRNPQNAKPTQEKPAREKPQRPTPARPTKNSPANAEPELEEIKAIPLEKDTSYDPNQAVDVDPYLDSLSEEAKYIIRLVGEMGVSRNGELKDALTTREDAKPYFFSGTKFQKNAMNNAVNDLINAQILTNEQINLGSRGSIFKIYELEDLGKHIYFALTNEIPVKSELSQLKRQHKSAEHGFLIKDSAEIFKEMGYTVYTSRKDLRHDLDGDNGKRKDFDIIIEKDGVKSYIEVERGTHNDEDFYKAMDKIRQITEEFYFICPNEEILFNKTKRQFFMWIQKHLGGMEQARGIKANFTTFGKLKEGKKPIWDDIEL